MLPKVHPDLFLPCYTALLFVSISRNKKKLNVRLLLVLELNHQLKMELKTSDHHH